MKCPYCGIENPDTALKCNCGYIFGEYRDDVEVVSSTTTGFSRMSFSSKFTTLITLGKTLSVLGWVWALISIIVGLTLSNEFQNIIPILGGICGAIPGFVIVAQGQLILCFISMERGIQDLKQEVINLNK